MPPTPFDLFHPGISLDCVIFGFHQNSLNVLLIKLKNTDIWALPGGFLKKEENLNDAATRVLQERTGLDEIFLHQFHTFGHADRVPKEHPMMIIDKAVLDNYWKEWISHRFITVGYYALVHYEKVNKPTPDFTSDACEWHPVSSLHNLMIDHMDIIISAYEELKKNLNQQPVGINLLPEKFTMPELRSLYETILGKQLDRRNFQRKIGNFDILIKTDERRKGGSHKAPILYKFDKEKYQRALESGLNSNW